MALIWRDGFAVRLLGIGRHSILRYVQGEAPVPEYLARLVHMLQKHGVPKEWRS